ncbi:hypothetical protein GYMLUDRAFT_411845 [Collybiopsis luxurians FD-317 M1]|nr:hypothetical protein GYMLUDRAFT_411845 [Collybiopsis luxurians FD-317 M1]
MREIPYISVLAASLLAIALLDIFKPQISEKHVFTVDAVLVLWLPSSAGISIWLLRAHKIQVPLPLPSWTQDNTSRKKDPEITVSLNHSVTLLAFCHFWLTLRRFLGGEYSAPKLKSVL